MNTNGQTSPELSPAGQSSPPRPLPDDVNPAWMFFELLFDRAVGAASPIAIWDKRTAMTAFFANPAEAAAYAIAMAEHGDVHFGAGLYRPDILRGRGTSDDVTAITSVWLDLDVHDPQVHPRNDLPLSCGEAMEFLDAFPLRPPIIVSSGHGLQAYWSFDEPWWLPTSTDRAAAADFLRRWGATVQSHAQQRGWQFDPVWDLARLLRVPGTTNWKTAPRRPVIMVSPCEEGPLLHHRREDIQRLFVPTTVAAPSEPAPPAAELPANIRVLLGRASLAANGWLFKKLWKGQWQEDYSSQSAADFAFCGMLAFWLKKPELIDAAFRASGLYRPKWDEKHYASGETYGEGTIRKILDGRTRFYNGPGSEDWR